MGTGLTQRLAHLEQRVERLTPAPLVRFTLWHDVEGGLVTCDATGETLTREEYQATHPYAITLRFDDMGDGRDGELPGAPLPDDPEEP